MSGHRSRDGPSCPAVDVVRTIAIGMAASLAGRGGSTFPLRSTKKISRPDARLRIGTDAEGQNNVRPLEYGSVYRFGKEAPGIGWLYDRTALRIERRAVDAGRTVPAPLQQCGC